MIFNTKNSLKSLSIGLVFLSALLPYNVANASILSNFNSGIKDIRGFYKITIGKIKNDFCTFYTLSKTSGHWGEKDIRVKIGRDICAGFKVQVESPSIDTQSHNIDESLNLSNQNKPNSSVPSTYLPNPLIGNISNTGNKLTSNEIIYWTNLERTKSATGLKTLSGNSVLAEIALSRVEDMFNKGYFAHVSPSGDSASKTADRDGYKYITIGENIALGNYESSRDLVNAWMNSPGHRANILNVNYSEIGVAAEEGIYQGGKVWISAQIFGRPLSDCTSPDETLKAKIAKDKISADSLSSSLKNIEAELKTLSSLDTSTYNTKATEYNNLAKQYNTLVAEMKKLTSTYNQEVQSFNDCIKTT